jgi:hypothetical protein
MGRHEEAQGPGLREEAVRVDAVDDGVDCLALEGSPDDSTVADSKLGEPVARQDLTSRDVEGVHDGYDVVVAGARALDVLEQLRRHQLVHVAPKVRRVQRHAPLQVVEEEHGGSPGRRQKPDVCDLLWPPLSRLPPIFAVGGATRCPRGRLVEPP